MILKKGKKKVIVKLEKEEQDFLDQIFELTKEHGRISLSGFGILELRDIPSRKGYNIITGGAVEVPAHKRLRYVPSSRITNLIQK